MLFNQKPKMNVIEDIQQRSEAAISIFKSTLETLKKIELEASSEIDKKEEQINYIKQEISTLQTAQVSNRKFINKLNEFFE